MSGRDAAPQASDAAYPAVGAAPAPARFALQTPVLLAGARCVMRYVLLPVVFPLAGAAAGATFAILVLLDVIAAITIATTLRRLWRLGHPRRRLYLMAALPLAAMIGLFLSNDARSSLL